ncbi:MAG: isopeptide-forming domain-containing fimbrial protein [Ruminococcaceae bacterium]|nr:isopeptide-forming domain-containing fimbrial protein [Oscillospiraceae bacterium]
MKNAKKVLAMVIVLALAISMAIPASAAAGTITITNVLEDGTVYKAWKMADLTWQEGAYSYTADAAWVNFFKYNEAAQEVYSIDAQNVVTQNDDATAEKVAAAAKAAVAYAQSINTTLTATAAAGTAVIDVTDAGYYVVDSTLGTICSIDTYGDGSANVNIQEKNDVPTLDKKVEDAYVTDAGIGDTVDYKLIVTKAAGAVNYVVEDTLSAGLTYNNDATIADDNDNVDVAMTKVVEGQKVTYTITGADKLEDGDTITISYSATVNEEAVIDGAGNTNEAVLKYGESNQFTSEPETAITYVWSFDLVKYFENAQGNNELLTGATFTLYSDAECQTAIQFVVDNGAYRVATAAEIADDEVTKVTVLTDTNGEYDIDGLDAGTYYLKEIAAPAGYNKVPDAMPITITGTPSQDGLTMTKSVNYNYDTDDDSTNDAYGVLNQSGAQLPETGGIGTVIFIAVGSFLVLAMGVLLVVRKRMSKVVYAR